ncbi:hypothetical protein ElyMa_002455300 [Elysia marginata]|uniref:Uncharacterized protein n=1 Tax=Elysia marginata TaxID=1093978 RepID=A0AAV4GKF3_9GAST|nr:hypothetical protein ElyMa_002455300 [Elysia marginata]
MRHMSAGSSRRLTDHTSWSVRPNGLGKAASWSRQQHVCGTGKHGESKISEGRDDKRPYPHWNVTIKTIVWPAPSARRACVQLG